MASLGKQLSTEDVCREAAEILGQMPAREDNELSKTDLLLEDNRQDRPPPYSGYPLGFGKEGKDSPALFFVPPPPPPSPGSALKATREQETTYPVPSAPPPPPPPPPLPQHLAQPPLQGNLTPTNAVPQVVVSPGYLHVPSATPAISHDGSLGPSPVPIQAPLPPSPVCTTTVGVQPEVPMANQPPTNYPPPLQVPVTSTPLMVQPPPPPPPPPLPLSASTQYSTQITSNQNVNTNNLNNVNVQVANTAVVDGKQRRYPNYLSFSIILCLLCWMLNPIVYICIIPALICSCYSCTANTYGKTKCSGKWAFSCNLTALICGLVSFVLLILPFVIVLALAAYGGFTALDALEDFMNTEP